MKTFRILSAVITVLALALSAGCSDMGASGSSTNGSSGGSSGGGY